MKVKLIDKIDIALRLTDNNINPEKAIEIYNIVKAVKKKKTSNVEGIIKAKFKVNEKTKNKKNKKKNRS